MSCDDEGVCSVPESNQGQQVLAANFHVSSPTSAAKKKDKIKIDVLADMVCPWCYLGKTKLELAIKDFNDVDFEIEYHPYFLAPALETPPPENMLQYLIKVLGPRIEAGNVQLQEQAKIYNLVYNDDRIRLATLNAHRLNAYMRKHHPLTKHYELVGLIFKAYMTDAKDISNVDFLVETSKKVGLDGEEIRRFLTSAELKDEVIAEFTTMKAQYKITSVPYYRLTRNGKETEVRGSQDPSVWKETFASVLNGH